jgi:hypothetical protein
MLRPPRRAAQRPAFLKLTQRLSMLLSPGVEVLIVARGDWRCWFIEILQRRKSK